MIRKKQNDHISRNLKTVSVGPYIGEIHADLLMLPSITISNPIMIYQPPPTGSMDCSRLAFN